MARRLNRFHQRLAASRALLGWAGISAVSVVLAAFTVTCSAHSDAGLMLRPGVELALDADSLPADGWYRVTNKASGLQVQAVAAPVSKPGEEEAEAIDTRYIRVPGARIAEGTLAAVALPDGVLAPQADRAYQLTLDDLHFTLALGSGGVYTVHIGEESYSFHVDAADAEGDSVVVAAADIDSDGKPDFIVRAGGQEVLLLSSRTQPGLNPPAAVLALHDGGC